MPDLSKRFALDLLEGTKSKLVTSRHITAWARQQSDPVTPSWVVALQAGGNDRATAKSISDYLYSTPGAPAQDMDNFHVACLFLRYERRELSWASFLDLAGRFTDEAGSEIPCEFFFEFLNALERSEYSGSLELEQTHLVRKELGNAISEALDSLRDVLKAPRSLPIPVS